PPGSLSTAESFVVAVPLAPRKTSVVGVEESRLRRSTMPVLAVDGPTLAKYVQGARLSPAVEKELAEVVTLRTEMGRREREMEGLRAQLADVSQRATELRESLRAVERTPRAAGLQQKLLERLNEATRQSEDLSAKLSAAGAAHADAKARLSEALRELRI